MHNIGRKIGAILHLHITFARALHARTATQRSPKYTLGSPQPQNSLHRKLAGADGFIAPPFPSLDKGYLLGKSVGSYKAETQNPSGP